MIDLRNKTIPEAINEMLDKNNYDTIRVVLDHDIFDTTFKEIAYEERHINKSDLYCIPSTYHAFKHKVYKDILFIIIVSKLFNDESMYYHSISFLPIKN